VFKALPADVQADIKSLWTTYQQSLKQSDDFLFGMGNPAVVKAAIDGVSFGKRLPEDYISCLAGKLAPAFAAPHRLRGPANRRRRRMRPYQGSTDGRKVSFLRYPDFDRVAHPELNYSVKVYLPKAAHSFRDYADSSNPPLLHRKKPS